MINVHAFGSHTEWKSHTLTYICGVNNAKLIELFCTQDMDILA